MERKKEQKYEIHHFNEMQKLQNDDDDYKTSVHKKLFPVYFFFSKLVATSLISDKMKIKTKIN